MDTVNTELIRGHVDTIILNSLFERDRYGYEILDIISDLSEGRYEIKQPTLYSCLKRLEKQGFISSYFGEESNGGRRRYYKLTAKGKETLEQDQREWEFSRTIINKLLSDKEIDLRTVEAPFDPNELRPLTRRVKAHDPKEETATDVPPPAPIVKYVYIRVPESAPIPEGATVGTAPQGAEMVEGASVEPVSVTQQDAMRALYDLEPQTPTTTQTEAQLNEAKITTQEDVNVNLEQVPVQAENVSVQPLNDAVRSAQDEEEALQIKVQQTKASKLLEIGEFARPVTFLPTEGEENGEIKYTTEASQIPYTARTTEQMNENFNYREALSAIFGDETVENQNVLNAVSESHQAEVERIENATRARQFGDVKQTLENDGFKLKVYQKSNTVNHYFMRFIYSNRINRDTALFTYLLLVIELLVMIIAKKAFGSPIPYVIFGAVAVLLPIVPLIVWALNPTKRIRAQFNFNQTISSALIVFVVITAITIVVSLLLDVDMKLGSTYAPVIIAANIPLGVVIYSLLYKSNNYHLKK